MFATDQPTAASSLPMPAAAGTQGYFTNGNPGTGVAATILDADFLNMMMEELLNIVTAGGLTPSKTTYNQVLTAIKTLGVGGQLGAQPHGQCRLSVASTTSLLLSPYNGNNVIVNGVPLQIPGAGLSVSNSGLAASTVYYVYLGGTTASPTLTLSTTGHTTQSNGITTQTGNAALTLVGMVATNSSSQFVDSQAFRFCLNWFNRRKLAGSSLGSGLTTTATGATKVSATLDINYINWADDQPFQSVYGNITNNTASGATTVAGYYNGTQAGLAQSFASTTANFGAPYGTTSIIASAEGVINTVSLYASVTSGTTGTISCNQSLNLFG